MEAKSENLIFKVEVDIGHLHSIINTVIDQIIERRLQADEYSYNEGMPESTETQYSILLKKSIDESRLSLSKICEMLRSFGLKTDKGQLSRLQNGKMIPAGDKINDALADVLNIDPIELKAAAYREKIPAEVLKRINNTA
ncbi:hypothetical protein [Paenibacillus pini]|uniref:Uncharacterized protein n=1 Tax=Paenibacillus pini JCM 16418 TaxID=1236976 RepID=W7YWP3_9BACL|nr:hypothetical protein [Paenibacillus pini]GAF06789.1 hypothetical protein JCM16418_771 [Paenibacillus pini JCM 16418]